MFVHIVRVLTAAALGALMLTATVAPASALRLAATAEPTAPRCDPNTQTCIDPPSGCKVDQTCPPPSSGCGIDQTCPGRPMLSMGYFLLDGDPLQGQ